MTDPETIGQRIKRERLKREMTQRDLANMIGVGTPHVSKVEAGRENPSDDLLERVAGVFDCDLDELLLAARRIRSELMEEMASNPQEAIRFFRQLRKDGGE